MAESMGRLPRHTSMADTQGIVLAVMERLGINYYAPERSLFGVEDCRYVGNRIMEELDAIQELIFEGCVCRCEACMNCVGE